ncbi:MAG TPA: septation regulator SpoVG [Haloplasmataceae bacterium]
MKVTNVRIRKVENKNRLKAIATITLDDCFVVHELRLIEGKNGWFVAMPSKKNFKDEYKDLCHPITQELREEIEEVVLKAYNELE